MKGRGPLHYQVGIAAAWIALVGGVLWRLYEWLVWLFRR